MFSTNFIFRQEIFFSQICQAGFRLLCNKILLCYVVLYYSAIVLINICIFRFYWCIISSILVVIQTVEHLWDKKQRPKRCSWNKKIQLYFVFISTLFLINLSNCISRFYWCIISSIRVVIQTVEQLWDKKQKRKRCSWKKWRCKMKFQIQISWIKCRNVLPF